MKTTIIAIVIILLLGAGAYFYMQKYGAVSLSPVSETPTGEPVATTTDSTTPEPATGPLVIGKSAGGRDIIAYRYGTGDTELLFVGGIHGGYEWNTVTVAREMMKYLEANPDKIAANLKVTVIPVLNPDGLEKTVGTTGEFDASDVAADTVPGRFNGNNVDLNRNFDCDWQAEGTWQTRKVSGGTSAFSEPESKAVRDYIATHPPTAVVVWYSAAGGVYASNCHDGVLPETATLTKLYADASKYPAYNSFNFYEITGDMVNWLAKEKIPAISVLLTTHTSAEWDKNKLGVDAILSHYAK